ncbi:aminopeptidase P family protein [Amorphus orientalis]|uniref:Xaa-Pro aminopeptidase n=1 Tax=Amorphus orientalis TaxID=649198 RepID=A0AAE4ASH9_9HYPH|nr:aminopeptidase P family protein [Amorphus orientalis]MDQ0315268.1 Xaa-Pro aminopeptidase [Amorphus orientalis]
MFQTFGDGADPSTGAQRLGRLRAELARIGVDGFIVPRADEYQGEYVPPSAERLAWLTGFTGSAGLAVVLADEAAVFVDGRYTTQVRRQVDTEAFSPVAIAETKPSVWLQERLTSGMKIGFDPRLHTRSEVQRFEAACRKADAELIALDANPLDAVWDDRPEPPLAEVVLYPEHLAGRSASDKIRALQGVLRDKGAAAAVLTATDSVAWLFNIRGSDIPHTPVTLANALVFADGRPALFVDSRKLTNEVRDALETIADVADPSTLQTRLADLGSAGATVLVDPDQTPEVYVRSVEAAGGTVLENQDPVVPQKAVKTVAEIGGSRAAHQRDGVALVRFLHWLDRQETGFSEIEAVKALETFRSETGALKEISFDTISGAGEHGAIVHYRVTERTDRRIETGELFLIDSGGQYLDGTTDVTRTVPFGAPSDEMKVRFTQVLKGHIQIAMARFPDGTSGAQLDALARIALWRTGHDFDHGTGHGVGAYLSVHEGPQRISKLGHAALKPGMIVSNEPGYYRPDHYGIRIENLVLVTPAAPIPGGEREMLGFETLTLAPIDRRLILPRLLAPAEIAWLDCYHLRVQGALAGSLDPQERAWLIEATRPIVG